LFCFRSLRPVLVSFRSNTTWILFSRVLRSNEHCMRHANNIFLYNGTCNFVLTCSFLHENCLRSLMPLRLYQLIRFRTCFCAFTASCAFVVVCKASICTFLGRSPWA
jgi:hypothetical protein